MIASDRTIVVEAHANIRRFATSDGISGGSLRAYMAGDILRRYKRQRA